MVNLWKNQTLSLSSDLNKHDILHTTLKGIINAVEKENAKLLKVIEEQNKKIKKTNPERYYQRERGIDRDDRTRLDRIQTQINHL